MVHHFQTENASAMKYVIKAIYESEESLSNDDIKNMLKIHFNSPEVDMLFDQYSEAKEQKRFQSNNLTRLPLFDCRFDLGIMAHSLLPVFS
jgi:hypothetical protein